MYSIIKKVVHRASDKAQRARLMKPVFLAFTLTVCLLFMFIKGPSVVKIKPVGLAILVALGCGIGLSLLAILAVQVHSKCKATKEDDSRRKTTLVAPSAQPGPDDEEEVS